MLCLDPAEGHPLVMELLQCCGEGGGVVAAGGRGAAPRPLELGGPAAGGGRGEPGGRGPGGAVEQGRRAPTAHPQAFQGKAGCIAAGRAAGDGPWPGTWGKGHARYSVTDRELAAGALRGEGGAAKNHIGHTAGRLGARRCAGRAAGHTHPPRCGTSRCARARRTEGCRTAASLRGQAGSASLRPASAGRGSVRCFPRATRAPGRRGCSFAKHA
jgi:hypothetical protein